MGDDTHYLSLSAASKLLGVHSTTLRRWADDGAVPVYVTPGGHRRFARKDIEALAARRPISAHALGSAWAA
ncbi:MAG: MerR family transcriptional regulator, partial [Chloroflexaceae bacterium]